MDESDKRQHPSEGWADKEEARVRANPAPPLWDENILDIHAHSWVKKANFRDIAKDWMSGNSPNWTYLDNRRLVLHFAVQTGDIPFLKAMGRYNCDYNTVEESTGRTALMLIVLDTRITGPFIVLKDEPRELSQRRLHIDTARWLLSRGVDPNMQDKRGKTALEYAIEPTKPFPIDIEPCKLLLEYRAKPDALSKCKDTAVKQQLEDYAERVQDGSIPKPPILCPCGNDVPVGECHVSEKGVPVHPRMHCPCKSEKLYGKCCMKRRRYLRETLTDIFGPPTIIDSRNKPIVNAMKSLYDKAHAEGKAKGLSEEEIGETRIFGNLDPEEIKHDTRVFMSSLASMPHMTVDPCFRWALQHPVNDFMYARPWYQTNSPLFILGRAEGERRRDEWNRIVDEYIVRKEEFGDTRSNEEIVRLNKINWQGSAYLKKCANPECCNKEAVTMTFKMCGKCHSTSYCSIDCQKGDWRRHKRVCGTHESLVNDHALPSSLQLNAAMIEFCQGAPPGFFG